MKSTTLLRYALALTVGISVASCSGDDDQPAQPTGRQATHIYWSSADSVFRMPIGGGTRELLFNNADGLRGVGDLAIDPSNGKLFILDWSGSPDMIYTGALDGSGTLTKVTETTQWVRTGRSGESFYGIDAVNGKLYIEVSDAFLGVCNADGSNRDTFLLNHSGFFYYDVAVDPATNTVYSTGRSAITRATIARNAQPQTPVERDSMDSAVRISLYNGRVYWSQTNTTNRYRGVLSKRTDGTGLQRIRNANFDLWGLAVDTRNGDVLVGDDDSGRLYRWTTSSSTLIAGNSGGYVEGIAVY